MIFLPESKLLNFSFMWGGGGGGGAGGRGLE